MKIKISKIILSITLLSSLLLSLTSCDEKEEHKIIQYQEEVKLSDGSMIWVDIKRHYGWSGYAPGMGEGAYLPGAVEISWDTGFEGVGRKSVFYQTDVIVVDKIADEWYVIGYRYPYNGSRDGIKATNCKDVGSLFNNDYMCLVVINKKGNFIKKNLLDVQHIDYLMHNILDPYDMKGWSKSEDDFKKLNNSHLSWNEKFSLLDNINHTKLNKPYSFTQQEHPR